MPYGPRGALLMQFVVHAVMQARPRLHEKPRSGPGDLLFICRLILIFCAFGIWLPVAVFSLLKSIPELSSGWAMAIVAYVVLLMIWAVGLIILLWYILFR